LIRPAFCLAIALMAHALAATASTPSAVAPTPASFFGLHIQRADDGSPWPPFRFGSWRLWDANVGWSSLEPERGKWFFRRLDRYVDLAERTGIDLVLPLALTPTWASARPEERSGYRPGNAAEARDIADWRNYVRTIGERYRGRILYYEIWNEPSDKTFFTGSVESLVALAAEAYKILKSIDPNIEIVSPAPAGSGHHLQYLDEYFSRGGREYTDIVGYHFYVWKTSPESMVPLIREVRRIMTKHGLGGKALWNTEFGYWIENSDGTKPAASLVKGWRMLQVDDEAPAYLARSFIVARSEGIERFFWYAWDSAHSFGMLEPALRVPKPMTKAYAQTMEWLLDRRLKGCTRHPEAVWACEVANDAGLVGWIVWREDDREEPWNLPVAWKATRIGRLLTPELAPLSGRSILVGRMPIFLQL
jgi:hypothetical protein